VSAVAQRIRVRAIQTGGVPRRRAGDVFDAPAGPDGKLRADYASWCEVVPEDVQPTPTPEPVFKKVDGQIVENLGGISGGGERVSRAEKKDGKPARAKDLV